MTYIQHLTHDQRAAFIREWQACANRLVLTDTYTGVQ